MDLVKLCHGVDVITNIRDSFPNCRLVSNCEFFLYKNDSNYFFTDNEDGFFNVLIDLFNKNYEDGTIVYIDEVQLFLLKTLDSPGSVYFRVFFAILSQLRKLNCLFIMTSQLWSKVPKILRDYILLNGNIITCKQLLPGLTYYGRYDMETIEEDSKIRLKGKIKKYDFCVHSPELYQAYNSYAVVSGISDLFKGGFKDGCTRSSQSNNTSN